jgi:ankyrin repeat protein
MRQEPTEQIQCLELLLEAPDIDLNLEDQNGWTPMWYAIASGELRAVEMLSASGKINMSAEYFQQLLNLATIIEGSAACMLSLLHLKREDWVTDE